MSRSAPGPSLDEIRRDPVFAPYVSLVEATAVESAKSVSPTVSAPTRKSTKPVARNKKPAGRLKNR
jgi:hypothetical protein